MKAVYINAYALACPLGDDALSLFANIETDMLSAAVETVTYQAVAAGVSNPFHSLPLVQAQNSNQRWRLLAQALQPQLVSILKNNFCVENTLLFLHIPKNISADVLLASLNIALLQNLHCECTSASNALAKASATLQNRDDIQQIIFVSIDSLCVQDRKVQLINENYDGDIAPVSEAGVALLLSKSKQDTSIEFANILTSEEALLDSFALPCKLPAALIYTHPQIDAMIKTQYQIEQQHFPKPLADIAKKNTTQRVCLANQTNVGLTQIVLAIVYAIGYFQYHHTAENVVIAQQNLSHSQLLHLKRSI